MWEIKGASGTGLVRAVARWNRQKSALLAAGKAWEKPGVSGSLRRKGNVEALLEGATDKHCSSSLVNSFFLHPPIRRPILTRANTRLLKFPLPNCHPPNFEISLLQPD